jgi:hypothetical protein
MKICVVLVIIATLSAFFAVNNIKISPDSMRFGVISQQILAGNGIRVPIIRLEDNYIPVNGAIPFLDQMPLTPLILALLGGVTPNNFLAGQILNLICHVIISLFTFLIMKHLYDNKIIALFTGILVSLSFPLLMVSHYIWSEPLFIALTVLSIYFLILSRSSNRYHFSLNLLAADIFACAAILTRNAGIALVLLFLWEAFLLIKDRRPGTRVLPIVLAAAIPIVTVIAMFVRNYVISGTLRGFHQPSPERAYFDAFTGTLLMIFRQFQLGRNGVIMISLLMTISIVYILFSSKAQQEIKKYFVAGVDLIIVFMVSYTGLIFLAMAKQAWNFELRLVSPLVPFLFIFSIFFLVFLWGKVIFQGHSTLSFIGLTLSLSILGSGSLYKTYLNVPSFLYKQENVYSILNSCTYNRTKENYSEHDIITTNKPFHLSFFGGYSTIALPHRRFDPNIHVPDDMESILPNRMYKFGSQTLVLFFKTDQQYDGHYIDNLFNKRESIDKFNLKHDCPDGVVYHLKK